MRTFSFIAAINHAIRTLRSNLGFAFHISWPWLLLIVPLGFWVTLGEPDLAGDATTPEQLSAMGSASLRFLATMALSLIAYSSIAVNWHRYVLLDEIPQGISQQLRLDRLVWRYLGFSILIGLILVAVSLPLSIGFGAIAALFGGLTSQIMVFYAAALIVVIMPAAYRLSLKLPAVALDNDTLDFRQCLEATRGQNLSLAFMGLVFLAAMLVIGYVLSQFVSLFLDGAGESAKVIVTAVREPLNWILAMVAISAQTSLYGFFIEKRDY